MPNATGFLVRNNLSDTGSLPRSGGWTGCPDIISAGTTAISRTELINSYGNLTDRPLTQGLTNYLYLRAKNMNATPLTQQAYMFQVPGSLVLRPELWYKMTNLVGYDTKGGSGTSPDDPRIIQKYVRTLSADAGGIAVTDSFNWIPESTEHHCIVGVAADSWQSVLANYPNGGDTMDGLAQWIYMNASIGWHNVTIQPVTSTIYEQQIPYSHSAAEEQVTFTIVAENVPVNARVSFSASTSTTSGQTLGQDWTTVSAPPTGGPINPDFEVGSTITVNAGYATIITYRTDFNGLPVPANFKMHMKATKQITPVAAPNSLSSGLLQGDSFQRSFYRSHSPNALFTAPSGEVLGRGVAGFRAMLAASPFDPGEEGDLEDSVVVCIGSHTTTPVQS